MGHLLLLDLAPGRAGAGIALLAVVIVLVIGLVLLLGAGLFFLLWFRKRGARRAKLIGAENFSTGGGQIQSTNPNQP